MNSAREWRTLGDHLALDLCNTQSSRLAPAGSVDLLATPAALTSWYRSVNPTAGSALAPVSAAERIRIIELRDAVTEILDAQVTGVPPTADPYQLVLTEYQDFVRAATTTVGLPLKLVTDGTIRHELSAAVFELLRSADVVRIRRCHGKGCGWFFIDGTRNHSRRWCDSEICGNRHRVRQYAQRHAPGSVT